MEKKKEFGSRMKPVIIIAIAFVLLIPLSVYAERDCKPDSVCVNTGDYLRFETQVGETLLEFNEEINEDLINFKWTNFNQDNSFDSENLYVLDRSSGKYTDGSDYDEDGFPLLHIYKIPLVEPPNLRDWCIDTQFDFNGINRDVLSCQLEDENGDLKIIIDTKTGITFLMNIGISSSLNITLDLLETNVFSSEDSSKGGGCLIATATYGSELAPQVQQLRELRDNSLLQTESGTSFMESFNDFYYSFSPIIADYERKNLVFKEMVKIAITPMISSLSILNYVDMDSEVEVLGYGISLIMLNVGMYFVAPLVAFVVIRKKF